MKEIPLIILASARRDSDTERFVHTVFAGMEYRLTDLADYRIAPYNYDHAYPADDGFMEVIGQMLEHRVVVFATPVYWYAMSGSMKVFFDRFSDLLNVHKPTGRLLKGRSVLLVSVGADVVLPEGFEVSFRLTAEYFDMEYRGSIYCRAKKIGEVDADSEEVQTFRAKMMTP